MSVVKFPVAPVFRRTVLGTEVWNMPTPSDLMVWEVCPFLREGRRCRHCPSALYDDKGRYNTCYVSAAEACRVVMAVQCREAGTIVKFSDKDR